MDRLDNDVPSVPKSGRVDRSLSSGRRTRLCRASLTESVLIIDLDTNLQLRTA
jgi:hypothetical protein